MPEQDALSVIAEELKALKQIISKIEYDMGQKMRKEAEIGFIKKEWRAIAVILDRFFFVIYLVAISMSVIYMFPRPS